jgi:phage shock protein A
MIDEHLEREIDKHRATARDMGEAALEAIGRGDAGLARSAARQAAQWARIVMQLESGEKQLLHEEPESTSSAAPDSGRMAV